MHRAAHNIPFVLHSSPKNLKSIYKSGSLFVLGFDSVAVSRVARSRGPCNHIGGAGGGSLTVTLGQRISLYTSGVQLMLITP